jgi:hypothetical protein
MQNAPERGSFANATFKEQMKGFCADMMDDLNMAKEIAKSRYGKKIRLVTQPLIRKMIQRDI